MPEDAETPQPYSAPTPYSSGTPYSAASRSFVSPLSPEVDRRNSLATGSLVLAIAALVIGVLPVLSFGAFVLAALALFCGIRSLRTRRFGRNRAVAGVTVAGVALAASALMSVLSYFAIFHGR
jgi:hypothetical protein